MLLYCFFGTSVPVARCTGCRRSVRGLNWQLNQQKKYFKESHPVPLLPSRVALTPLIPQSYFASVIAHYPHEPRTLRKVSSVYVPSFRRSHRRSWRVRLRRIARDSPNDVLSSTRCGKVEIGGGSGAVFKMGGPRSCLLYTSPSPRD